VRNPLNQISFRLSEFSAAGAPPSAGCLFYHAMLKSNSCARLIALLAKKWKTLKVFFIFGLRVKHE
jgi:hypothetical protein